MTFVDTVREFHALGCDDDIKCALGVRVFLDLECDKRVTKLSKCYDSELNLVYLQGERDNAVVTFVPVLSSQPLNFVDLESIQKKLIGTDSKSAAITIAICDTSTNVLYYEVTPGVVDKKL
ncbi:PREDICTED: uncharacterized protein LOC108380089 [Rhagoletis zephyria]|uniref:uncharacterized protein LOC108380089 n=1 Tax=Rhagoletis zephyria TaxID=28612 RepID=UPI0008119A74|nr:PREDICTED: uncharacterized protein LOC108380089 [Rhagoletis zephyria]XP_017491947.1 PREDICTED: uncharacterized protein LOC108380089 [Rhagoletis zephyria]